MKSIADWQIATIQLTQKKCYDSMIHNTLELEIVSMIHSKLTLIDIDFVLKSFKSIC